MYLKSIEVQGFKSFANKIVFEFQNGITAIVGPNGSGKSNVADAVRWVLGEQSAKQLRGSKMEDVIFAGTQARKAVGFAYVSITLDNTDHALPVDYEEVTVSRRVFRSGESEYQINGHACRLKDITELFYDTGIGKEGYSIIGQGQIDKILSGKPDERRELFDEAAGIVKFKRRKAEAQKKLENERANLVRVNDILSELENQVGPLQNQAEKAKTYLNLRDDLKTYDINAFLLESEQMKVQLQELTSRQTVANADLDKAKADYESTKSEYEVAEQQLDTIGHEIDSMLEQLSNAGLECQKKEGMIRVCEEQVKTIQANNTHYSERLRSIASEVNEKQTVLQEQTQKKEALASKLIGLSQQQEQASAVQAEFQGQIEQLTRKIEGNQNQIYEILNQKSTMNADNQRYRTILEQLTIKKAELSSKLIASKSEQNAQDAIMQNHQQELTQAETTILQWNQEIQNGNSRVADVKARISDISNEIDKTQQQYHREKSRLESLINITERYDGYGNSIRKIMERKTEMPGILGVIADLVKVEKRYETAIETALGGTIQNIVTDNENTAKQLITYLKENKLGRATFLPLSSIQVRNTLERDACIQEEGVIGVASELVRVPFEYEKLTKYLLGRILVVDHIDHALAIARKYKHTLRIVTLEGEQLNPGGSMTGGAFKNSSNLLGRRREIEEIKKNVSNLSAKMNDDRTSLAQAREELSGIRSKLEEDQKNLREAQIQKNTAQMNLKQATLKRDEIRKGYDSAYQQVADIEVEIEQMQSTLLSVSGNLDSLSEQKEWSQKEIYELNQQLEAVRAKEAAHARESENIKISYSSALQEQTYMDTDIHRVEEEIARLQDEQKQIEQKMKETDGSVLEKQKEMEEIRSAIIQMKQDMEQETQKVEVLRSKRDEVNKSHKIFFERREKMNEQIGILDKECYRLRLQSEKINDAHEELVNYMWNEYELTYRQALPFKNPQIGTLSQVRQHITALKNEIRDLGNVNVNAIEEYKEINERYTFLKTQHDDLMEAEKTLMTVIEELDTGMRIQFAEKFQDIKAEFDQVFRELFGGGRGTIELVEGEDILEAGIVIISQPPGKKLQNMMQLSGGEKALTAIALLFAIQNLKPSPFCLLDEIEAALDDSNVGRYAGYLHKLTTHTQFIVITHRRGTMAAADRLYGITMQEKGISALVSVDLIEDDLDTKKNSA